jgi:hypothetical protein
MLDEVVQSKLLVIRQIPKLYAASPCSKLDACPVVRIEIRNGSTWQLIQINTSVRQYYI